MPFIHPLRALAGSAMIFFSIYMLWRPRKHGDILPSLELLEWAKLIWLVWLYVITSVIFSR